MGWKQYLFSFKGRIGRGRWWFGQLLLVVLRLATVGILVAIGAAYRGEIQATQITGQVSPAVYMIYGTLAVMSIIAFWAALALAAKRCHDRGRSAWFLLVGLIPLVNFWVVVELGILKGEPGPNRFGEDPQGVNYNEVFA